MERAVLARGAGARLAAWTAAVAALLLLTAVVAVYPAAGVAFALVLAGAAAAYATRRTPVRVGRASVAAPLAVLGVATLAAGGAAVTLAIAVWPPVAALVAALAAFLALVWRTPAVALAIAVLLFGFEGSVKVLLAGADGTLPAGNRAVGAAFLDACLFAAIAVLAFRDRLRAPAALWAVASRAERIVLLLLAAWLALSALQIAQGGALGRGIEGFRLFQAYVLTAAGVLVALRGADARDRAPLVMLGVGLMVGLYATFRVLFGASEGERQLALSVETVTRYGGKERATGSFSSAVGLTSFLTPVVVFAAVAGYFVPRLRWLAWATAALGVIGIVGSYGRAPVFAIALGLVFALVVTVSAAHVPRRRKLVAAGLVLAVLAGTYGAVWVAGQTNEQLQDRAEGVLNPIGDESVQIRFDAWDDAIAEVRSAPFGHGVGTVGSASGAERSEFRTTDNSFIKVLYEQGILVGAAFAVGLFSLAVLLAARLRRAGDERRAVGLAALAGFVAFLGLSLTGEYVEQPGKVVAWALFGLALAQALGLAGRGTGSGAPGTQPQGSGA